MLITVIKQALTKSTTAPCINRATLDQLNCYRAKIAKEMQLELILFDRTETSNKQCFEN